ncbi:MAG: hypothetical protein E6J06_09475 [Chloroflexi bacterium]|nr:MAG: hypothetical protein E6J06_09475 [Chloroflexota bacterium]
MGGFVTFPGRTYQEDPAGGIVWVGDGEVVTQADPKLHAFGDSPFYDLAMKRWMSAGPGQTAPDGRTYAYAANELGGPHATVILVNVATGAERGFFTMNMHAHVDDFDGRYAYLVGDGVWRMDTSTGALEQVSREPSTIFVRGGNLWVGRVNRADPSPPNASPARIELPQAGRLFDSSALVNPTTGTETTWIYSPGQELFLLGLDAAGHPVVSISHGPDFNARLDTVLVLSSPGDAGTHISDGAVLLNHMQADGSRLWFGSDAPGGYCV